MIMITYFDLTKTHTPATVLLTIEQIDKENKIVAVFSDNTMKQYSREAMYDFEIAEEIYDHICEKQGVMFETALEKMCETYFDETDAMFEIEDVKMRHCYV